MKRLMTLIVVITSLFAMAGVASAEHGNVGGVGFKVDSMGSKQTLQ